MEDIYIYIYIYIYIERERERERENEKDKERETREGGKGTAMADFITLIKRMKVGIKQRYSKK